MTRSDERLTEEIRRLMSEALGREIEVQTDFFAAGADSLAVEHVLTGLSGLLGMPIDGWWLLDYPTATLLAHALS